MLGILNSRRPRAASAFRPSSGGRPWTGCAQGSCLGRLGPSFSVVLASLLTLAFASTAVAAQPPVGLGTADSFAVLAGSTVTNTGPSVIHGDLAVSPGTAVTGFPPGTVFGTIHAADGVAGQAKTDLTTAYNDAAGRTPPNSVSGNLGGQTLTPGVYKSTSSLGLTGALTLDAQGDPNAVFVFQAGSTLITASGSSVNLIGGAQACNVFWQVGSSATLGTNSTFRGNILALTSGTLNTGANVDGRVLARNGAVTLDDNVITTARCATSTGGGGTGGGGTGGGGTTGGGTTTTPGGTTGGGTTGGGTTTTPGSTTTTPGGTTGGGTTGGGTTTTPGGTTTTPGGTTTTPAAPPLVTTGSASPVGTGGGRLHGKVHPNGATTTYYFEYGTTRKYGRRTSKLPAGFARKTFKAKAIVRGLRPGTLYDYRLVAVSPLGTRFGANRTFRTASKGHRGSTGGPKFTG